MYNIEIFPPSTSGSTRGNYIAPYYLKEGDVRAQVKCRYCELSSSNNGLRKCIITRKKCVTGYIFCDMFKLRKETARRIRTSGMYSGEPLPMTGGWIESVEPFHSL